MIGLLLWITLGVTLLGGYSALLLKDDKTPETDLKQNLEIEKDWHFVGASLFVYIALSFWISFNGFYACFALSLFWLLYGGIVHTIGLNKPFFFVGTTAWTDKMIRKVFSKNPELLSAILKILFLVISLILIINEKTIYFD